MFKLNEISDADSLLYLHSHFECCSYTIHMFTQWHLLPPLTSTVRLSSFTHVCSNPLSLAARLHQRHTNCSCYINNGWTFSEQTSCIYSIISQYLLSTLRPGLCLLSSCHQTLVYLLAYSRCSIKVCGLNKIIIPPVCVTVIIL